MKKLQLPLRALAISGAMSALVAPTFAMEEDSSKKKIRLKQTSLFRYGPKYASQYTPEEVSLFQQVKELDVEELFKNSFEDFKEIVDGIKAYFFNLSLKKIELIYVNKDLNEDNKPLKLLIEDKEKQLQDPNDHTFSQKIKKIFDHLQAQLAIREEEIKKIEELLKKEKHPIVQQETPISMNTTSYKDIFYKDIHPQIKVSDDAKALFKENPDGAKKKVLDLRENVMNLFEEGSELLKKNRMLKKENELLRKGLDNLTYSKVGILPFEYMCLYIGQKDARLKKLQGALDELGLKKSLNELTLKSSLAFKESLKNQTSPKP